MNDQRERDETWHEILYWGLALVGLVGLKQVWTAKLRPWIEATWVQIEAGGVDLPLVGTLDRTDLVGVGLLVCGFVVAVFVWRARRRHRRTGERWGVGV